MSEQSDSTVFQSAFERIAIADGSLVTAKRLVGRVPASNPVKRALRQDVVDDIGHAISLVIRAAANLAEIEEIG